MHLAQLLKAFIYKNVFKLIFKQSTSASDVVLRREPYRFSKERTSIGLFSQTSFYFPFKLFIVGPEVAALEQKFWVHERFSFTQIRSDNVLPVIVESQFQRWQSPKTLLHYSPCNSSVEQDL